MRFRYGESVINDAVSIVGFNTMSKFLLIPLSFKAVMEAIGTFIILFIGSAVRPLYDHQI